jgi:hypothetical protein
MIHDDDLYLIWQDRRPHPRDRRAVSREDYISQARMLGQMDDGDEEPPESFRGYFGCCYFGEIVSNDSELGRCFAQ